MSLLPVRARLTLVYGGFFLLAGVALLGVTYVLTDNAVRTRQISASVVSSPDFSVPLADPVEERERQAKNAQYEQNLQDSYRQQVLRTMVTQGGIALGFLGLAGMVVGWFVASRSLRPLRRITATAHRVAASSMHERVLMAGPRDELRELADAFDAMLGRLDASFEAQRRFVANASHELRTPVTINRTLVEVAMARPDAPPEVLALGARLLEVNARQEQTMEALLDLARAEQPLAGAEMVDLAEITQSVARAAKTEAEVCDVTLDLAISPATTVGNAVLWERLVTNLVLNAIRHNHSGGTAWITVGSVDGRARLEVSNTGPRLAPDDVDGLFEPFRRHRDRLTTTPGSGLGLSIVRAVAHAHQASVRASARSEGGLRVVVTGR